MARRPSRENTVQPLDGWLMLVVLLVLSMGPFTLGVVQHNESPAFWVPVLVVATLAGICLAGLFIVNPNMARVLLLFGRYKGTVRHEGFYWVNPFTVRQRMSLRAQNLASQTIKVNDLTGNPIEIGAVVVWQVRDTAQASFDVENHHQYVDVQIEAAVRQLAKNHPYDENSGPTDVQTLRGDTQEVTDELRLELQQRLERAGIEVLEARISHLAYAPEIASAMLQRQQAQAIVAAREKIVEGAVSMVEQALNDLGRRQVVELDPQTRARLVGNLLVVLCGNSQATPVIQTGSSSV